MGYSGVTYNHQSLGVSENSDLLWDFMGPTMLIFVGDVSNLMSLIC